MATNMAILLSYFVHVHEQSMNHIFLAKGYAKSPILQNANTGPHQLCWGDWKMELLSHAVRWLSLPLKWGSNIFKAVYACTVHVNMS